MRQTHCLLLRFRHNGHSCFTLIELGRVWSIQWHGKWHQLATYNCARVIIVYGLADYHDSYLGQQALDATYFYSVGWVAPVAWMHGRV